MFLKGDNASGIASLITRRQHVSIVQAAELDTTEPSILRLHTLLSVMHLPPLATHSSHGIKDIFWVPPALDLTQPGVVPAIETLLPVFLLDTGLVEVRPATLRDRGKVAPQLEDLLLEVLVLGSQASRV